MATIEVGTEVKYERGPLHGKSTVFRGAQRVLAKFGGGIGDLYVLKDDKYVYSGHQKIFKFLQSVR